MIIIYANFVKSCNKKLEASRIRDHLGRGDIKLLVAIDFEGLEKKVFSSHDRAMVQMNSQSAVVAFIILTYDQSVKILM